MVKVSMIIPVYNAEKYLKECLDSIFIQTLKDIEVVCINDGSTDNSLTILDDYKKRQKNMVIFTQENAGSGHARNTGIEMAKGEFLMFVDPDDYLAGRRAVEALYRAAKDNHVDVCGGNLLKDINNEVTLHNNGLFKDYIPQNGMFTFKNYQFAYAHTRYIIKREHLISNNIRYPEYLRGQDIPFMAKVLNAAARFYLIDQDIYVHRKGHKQENYIGKRADDFAESLYDVLNIAIDNHLETLFSIYSNQIFGFANQFWYERLRENNTWEKAGKINECIRRGNQIFKYSEDKNILMDQAGYDKYIKRMEKSRKEMDDIIDSNTNIVIYGAGRAGQRVYRYLKDKNRIPSCFAVSDSGENEKMIESIPVVPVNELEISKKSLFVLSAANPQVREDMGRRLIEQGYSNILNLELETLKFLRY